MRKWTDKEDKLIIEYAEKHKNNIRNGFKELSIIIDRSSEAIVSRFYNVLNKDKAEKLSLFAVSVAVDFAKWIGEKRCKDDWFRYDDKTGKWFVYLKGHLTTNELFEMWQATEH